MTNFNLVESNGRAYLPCCSDKEPIYAEDRGIRQHNWLTAFFVRLFGSGIITFTSQDQRTFYLNRNSAITWIRETSKKNHEYWSIFDALNPLPTNTDEEIATMLQRVLMHASWARSDKAGKRERAQKQTQT